MAEHHWAAKYIGRPYQAGGDGPEAFDCWGFAAHVQSLHYGQPFPAIDRAGLQNGGLDLAAIFAQYPVLNRWAIVAHPQDGDVVTCKLAGRTHIGTWLSADGGGVLHCVEPADDGRGIGGVCFTDRTAMRVAGWGRLTFRRYA